MGVQLAATEHQTALHQLPNTPQGPPLTVITTAPQVMVAPGTGAGGGSCKVDPNWTFLKLFKDIDVADVDM